MADKAPGEASLEAEQPGAPPTTRPGASDERQEVKPENAPHGDRLGRLPQQLPVQRADGRLQQGQRRPGRSALLRGQPGQARRTWSTTFTSSSAGMRAQRRRATDRRADHRQPRRRRVPQAGRRGGRPAHPPGQRGRRADARGRAHAEADPAARPQGLRRARPAGVPAHSGPGAATTRTRRCWARMHQEAHEAARVEEPARPSPGSSRCPLDEVVAATRSCSSKLDPKPGRNFSGDDAQYITPDVSV